MSSTESDTETAPTRDTSLKRKEPCDAEVETDHDGVTDQDRSAAAEKHKNYLLYHRRKYDRTRERVLARRKAKYIPTGRPVGRPKLPRE